MIWYNNGCVLNQFMECPILCIMSLLLLSILMSLTVKVLSTIEVLTYPLVVIFIGYLVVGINLFQNN